MNFEILSGDEWQRVLAFVRDLKHDPNYNSNRLVNVLRKAGWSQFTSQDYARACAVLEAHYKAKDAAPQLTEEQAFHEGEQLESYDIAIWLQKARRCYANRDNKKALKGYALAFGSSARCMARAVHLWPKHFDKDNLSTASVAEIRSLFALASIENDEQARQAYDFWSERSMSYWDTLQYVDELRSKKRKTETEQYKEARRSTKSNLKRMKMNAPDGKVEKIQGVIQEVEKL